MSSIEERTHHEPTRSLGDVERVFSTLIGAALVVGGGRRRSLAGCSAALAGAALVARGITGRCPVSERLGRVPRSFRKPVRIVENLQVAVPPEAAYRAWRDLEGLPRFMRHVSSVSTSNGHSHWIANLRGLPPIEWDAELVQDVPGQVLSWRSLPDGPIENSGSVTFFDLGPRGTGLRVEIGYYPPAGAVGRAVARLLDPVTEQQVREDVRRFKSLLEAGEIPTTEGQPNGRKTFEVAR